MIPVRFEQFYGLSTESVWRFVERLEHGDLCRAFSLDPHRHRFDLPRTAHNAAPGVSVSGYVMRDGEEKPCGRVHVAREGSKFRDLDPLCRRDQLSLDRYA